MITNTLSISFRNEVSVNGYRLDVLKSALQKYIRRNIEDKALYTIAELELFKLAGNGAKHIKTNIIHRLMICALEDVGPADLSAIMAIAPNITNLLAGTINDNLRADYAKIVMILCRAKKSRVCSHVRAACDESFAYLSHLVGSDYPEIANIHDSYKDIAPIIIGGFDELCAQFADCMKKKQWTAVILAHNLVAANVKVNEYRRRKPVWRLFRLLAAVNPGVNYAKMHALMMDWYKEIENTKESFLCWLILIIIHILGVELLNPPQLSQSDIDSGMSQWAKNMAGDKIEIDEFVIDKHTKEGRNASMRTFALVGAVVTNEVMFNEEFKRFYELTKKIQDALVVVDGTLYETTYEFVVRAQLNTSAAKADVYFATKSGRDWVVKGPLTQLAAENALNMVNWKKTNNLPYVFTKIEYMLPDRWPEGVPLGVRNSVNRIALAPFLVSESVVPISQLTTKIHSSKVWPDTQIVDWNNSPRAHLGTDLEKQLLDLGKQAIIDYITALVVRYVFGISDCANRNFIIHNGRIISIDEEYKGYKVNLAVELRKNKLALVIRWIHMYYDDLQLDRLDFGKPVDTSKQAILAMFGETA